MTAPAIVGSWTTSGTSLGTSHSITLPSGINDGDYVFVFGVFENDGAGGSFAVTTPSGWTMMNPGSQNAGPLHNVWRTFSKYSYASESGTTLTITTNENAVAALAAVRVDSFNGAPYSDGVLVNGGSFSFTGANPANAVWSDGPWDTLVFQIFGLNDTTPTFSALIAPSGYILDVDVLSTGLGYGGGTHNAKTRLGVAHKTIAAMTSEDAGSWTGYDAGVSALQPLTVTLHITETIPVVTTQTYWGINSTLM